MRPTVLFVAFTLASCGPPVMNTPIDDIPKLTTLAAVMDNQATVADPEMKKAGESSYTDADYNAFAKASERIKVLSLKIKDFSKGPDFDALAMQLNAKAETLGKAALAKDAAGSSQALQEMKATCKDCHSKFR
jgi:cytochrome c556